MYQAEFAYNRSVNFSTGFSPFVITYGYNPHTPLDLAPIPDLKHVKVKAEDLIAQIQEIHTATARKIGPLEIIEIGDFVWVILTKDHFPVGEYNKLAARKIGPLEIIEKINPNAYQLKLPSHMRTSDVFNVKHLVPYRGENSNPDSKLEDEFLPTQGG